MATFPRDSRAYAKFMVLCLSFSFVCDEGEGGADEQASFAGNTLLVGELVVASCCRDSVRFTIAQNVDSKCVSFDEKRFFKIEF